MIKLYTKVSVKAYAKALNKKMVDLGGTIDGVVRYCDQADYMFDTLGNGWVLKNV